MEDMDIDSPPPKSLSIRPRDRIVRRLATLGVHEELLNHLQPGLVAFVKDKKSRIPEFVAAILPSDEEVAEFLQEAKAGSKKHSKGLSMQNLFSESMIWLQWLMFEGEPITALKNLSEMSVGQRGVCGSVWGHNDIAYRCRTCEHDPTCAICVPCFQNGNHKDHDYSIIYTGGGCCDCGDVTAWKREGFCSEHKGAEQIQPLSEEFANSVGPVLDAMFVCWKNKLQFAESVHLKNPRASDWAAKCKKVANELTFAVVEMLLQFCKHSESLLSFVSKMLISSAGILEILVRAERFLCDSVMREVHELLLKLLGEPMFKYEFAKVFLSYYPVVVNEAIEELKDNALKKYPLLSTFSVQIYTVPTLTPRLVKEMNLLAMLLGCLGDIFVSCAGEDGRMQLAKWGNLYETTMRVVEDIRFVMSHAVVPRSVIHDQLTFSRNWLGLLALVHGMNPLRRETGLHIEEENEFIHLPFGLCHSIANIHSLLVDGAFSVASTDETDDETSFTTYKQSTDDIDSIRHAKVGRLSQESSACTVLGKSSILGSDTISPPALWLTHECLRAIDKWLQVDNTSGTPFSLSRNTGDNSGRNFVGLKKMLSRTRKGKFIFGRLSSSSEEHSGKFSSQINSGFHMSIDHENDKSMGRDGTAEVAGETNSVNVCNFSSVGESMLEGDHAMDFDVLHILSLSDWPNIVYDVSSQDISVHIPLHRLLSLLLQKALRKCFGEPALPKTALSSSSNLSAMCTDFFAHFLMGCHPHGFSAFVMEHPLRIRVFCAQLYAGMWRKNGDAAIFSCELYRSVRWSEWCLELDLFLLQCCAALAPADLYVNRILERFGLSDYLSLNVERSSEYEPVLVREMLTLIIQIVKERRFCGITVDESLKRELIYKLAIGDTTHSQLVKSLPRDLSKCSQLQEILDTITVYSQPSGFKQGMYSLQWAYWRELDLHHPRWSSRDLQVAEERYMRFCSVSALTTQLPKWTKIYPPFKGLARVATCKEVLQIVRAVLFYAVFEYESTESRAPDSVLLTALHLLALALDICYQEKESNAQLSESGEQIPLLAFASEQVAEGLTYGDDGQSLLSLLVVLMRMHRTENLENYLEAGNYNLSSLVESLLKKFAEIDSCCMAKLQQLAPEITCHLSKSASNSGTNSSHPTSDGEKRRAKAREKQAAILEKMRAEQSKFMASIDSSADDDSDSGQQSDTPNDRDNPEEAAQIVCSLCHDSSSNNPMSFLILLQKSRLLSFIDRGPLSWKLPRSTKEHVSTTSKMVMDHSGASTSSSGLGVFSSSQLVKMVQNAIRECNTRGQPGDGNAFLESLKAWFPSLRNIQMPSTSSAREERTLHALEKLEEDMYLSICKGPREMLPSHKDNKILTAETGLKGTEDTQSALLVKYIAALSREVTKNPSTSENNHNDNMLVESNHPPAYDGLSPPDCDGIHISSCGHAVHQGCLDRYLSSLKERFVRRIVFEGGHIVDTQQGEFLCPVCRRLANSVLPALPGESQKIRNHAMSSTFCSAHASTPLDKSSEDINSIYVRKALGLLQSAANVVEKGEILNSFPLHKHGRKGLNPEPISRVLSKMYFPGKQDKLLGSSRVSPSMLMWDTLKYSLISMEIAARCSRNSMTPTIGLDFLYKELESSSGFILSLLLKAVQSKRSKDSLHVLQRFRGIQSFGKSICLGISRDHAGDTWEGGDNILCILKHIDMESSFPDIQFWSRASDPVLGRDPFSSLMWVLFCLPYPFLSCEESFISFVHLFYIVSVAQAIVTYCGKYQYDKSETGSTDCLISDIFKAMQELGSTREYFVSNYIKPSSNITHIIHSLSFPYLRRCALLWKLMNSSARSPLFDGDNMLERPLAASHIMDTSAVELSEVDKLEKMFQIPSLDILLKDSGVRSLVSKWFCHFSKEIEVNRFRGLVHCTPAVPFHLMRLPRVYHNLLQRYIKQTCIDCESVIDDPALCLLCGRLCSSSWKPCCRENGCLAHAVGCGAGTGIFLLIKKTTILLQRSARQAPWPSPYLDAFGEEDDEMNRGKPLYLNEERYAALTYMVACHGLDRSSKVLGQTTIDSFFMI